MDLNLLPRYSANSATRTKCVILSHPHTISNQTVKRDDSSIHSDEHYSSRDRRKQENKPCKNSCWCTAKLQIHAHPEKSPQNKCQWAANWKPSTVPLFRFRQINPACRKEVCSTVQRSTPETSDLVTQPELRKSSNAKQDPGRMKTPWQPKLGSHKAIKQ